MPKVETMKLTIFLLATFSIQLALGAQVFSGYLTKKDSNYYLTTKNSEILYKVTALTYNVDDSLKRLENGDLILGNGSFDVINKKINIESIDYVGLRRLLGPWVGTDGIMDFKDFSTMRFTPRYRNIHKDINGHLNESIRFEAKLTNYQKEFRYSMSPGDGNEWALFVSDDKGTNFATVVFSTKKIIMKIFESESGKIVRTLKLERP
jgi:hypothetical protein